MPRNPNQPRPKDTRTAPKDKKAKEAAAAPGPAATAPAAAPSTSGAAEPKPKRLKVNLPTSLAAAIPNEVTTRLGELEAQRKRLTDQLRDTEKQIFELESRYLEISNPQGNALKGEFATHRQLGTAYPCFLCIPLSSGRMQIAAAWLFNLAAHLSSLPARALTLLPLP